VLAVGQASGASTRGVARKALAFAMMFSRLVKDSVIITLQSVLRSCIAGVRLVVRLRYGTVWPQPCGVYFKCYRCHEYLTPVSLIWGNEQLGAVEGHQCDRTAAREGNYVEIEHDQGFAA
jgi:hypothetical protein